ncbi:TPA: hypothetical protein ACY4UK_001436 [Clostridium perfringens]
MEIKLPLISPLSRKYYTYAGENNERVHHRAVDVRLCLEYVCDEIVIQFVSPKIKKEWKSLNLDKKIKASKEFMDNAIVDEVLKAKIIGNKGAHNGEEGNYNSKDIDSSLEAIKKFSLEIFYSYFVQNGFGTSQNYSWIPTVFSTLPPIYRVEILKKYYTIDSSPFVIDKLSKAYLKSKMKDEAVRFLEKCFNNDEINVDQFETLMYDLEILEKSISRFKIANNLDEAKNNFNCLLPLIEEDKKDSFICLVSMILNGET